MMETTQDTLLVERRSGLLWLTLHRPDKANALTVSMVEGLTTLMQQAIEDPEIQAVLLTGSGERVFCAGVDIREQAPDGDAVSQRVRRAQALALLQDMVLDCPKPVVTALNGTASGAGAMLALLSDACVAVDTAALSLPEIDIGIATFSGFTIAQEIGGRAIARDLVQSGRRMPAAQALAGGLLQAVVARADLIDTATSLAQSLGSKKQSVFSLNKQWINRGLKSALSLAREEHAQHRGPAAQ